MSYLPGEEPATKSDVRRLEERIEHLDDKLDRRMDEFHFALLAQGRTYVIASSGSILSTGALVAAITA